MVVTASLFAYLWPQMTCKRPLPAIKLAWTTYLRNGRRTGGTHRRKKTFLCDGDEVRQPVRPRPRIIVLMFEEYQPVRPDTLITRKGQELRLP